MTPDLMEEGAKRLVDMRGLTAGVAMAADQRRAAIEACALCEMACLYRIAGLVGKGTCLAAKCLCEKPAFSGRSDRLGHIAHQSPDLPVCARS